MSATDTSTQPDLTRADWCRLLTNAYADNDRLRQELADIAYEAEDDMPYIAHRIRVAIGEEEEA